MSGPRRALLILWPAWAWWRWHHVADEIGWDDEGVSQFVATAVVFPLLMVVAAPWVFRGFGGRRTEDPAIEVMGAIIEAERWILSEGTLDDLNRASLVSITSQHRGVPTTAAVATSRVVAYDFACGSSSRRAAAAQILEAAQRDIDADPILRGAYVLLTVANRDRLKERKQA